MAKSQKHDYPETAGNYSRTRQQKNYNFPRTVYKVQRDTSNGDLFVAKRTLLGKTGSWYIYKTMKGVEVRENGNRWDDTISEAIFTAALNLMSDYRHGPDYILRDYDENQVIKDMMLLLEETFAWGKLFGKTTPQEEELKFFPIPPSKWYI